MSRVSQLAQHTLTLNNVLEAQKRVQDAQIQIATGAKSLTYAGISEQASRLDGFVRRLRVGGDFTQIIGQFTLRSEISGGEDFEQSVFNALGEIDWTTSDEKFSAYLQLIYLGQDGHFGWDEDLETRLGFLWKIDNNWKLSGQWIHDFLTYAKEAGGLHFNDDIWSLQLRFTF